MEMIFFFTYPLFITISLALSLPPNGPGPGPLPIFDLTTDQHALLAFRNAVVSDPHAALTANWSASSSPCHWAGVSCGPKHQRVTGLTISGLGLVGPLDPHLGNLTFLRTLDLSSNNFTGPIRPEIFTNLRRLVTLNLSSNQLSGPIPSGLFNVSSSVETIDMRGNMLSGELPSDVCGDFSSIKMLYLSRNGLEGGIPANISKCGGLEELNLAGNKFRGKIPSGVWSLPKLRLLALYENQLQGFEEGSPANMPEIEELWLSENKLTGVIPTFIFNISTLTIIDLSSNYLSGNIPAEAPYNLPHISELYLYQNNLTGGIPKQFGNLTSLVALDFASNLLTGELPEELGNLGSLDFFSAPYNRLSGPIPPSLFNISTMMTLYLQQNLLSGSLPPDIIPPFSRLQYLIIHFNELTGPIPGSIANASALIKLELNKNWFSGPVPDFGSLANLEALRLWENNLTATRELTFISSLSGCQKLEVLEISNNPFEGTLPSSVGNLSASLVRFFAGDCKIVGPIPHEFGNLKNLQVLELSENRLTGLIPEAIGGLSQLYALSLGGNQLHGHIPSDICRLRRLGELYLYDNSLMGPLPDCFGQLKSLTIAHLYSNEFNSTVPPSLWNLVDLNVLNLSRNSLTGELSPLVRSLKVLGTLDLSSNQLTGDIPSSISDCQSLDFLSLSNNNFGGTIPESLGENLRGLTTLDLSNNNLSGSIPKSLLGIRFLRKLNFSYNMLSGEIPDEGPFRNFTATSFTHNSALCGPTRFRVPPCGPSRNSRTVLTVIKYALPLFAATAIAASVATVLLMRRRRGRTKAVPQAPPDEIPIKAVYRRISYRELERGTSSFNETNLLGRGGFGSVYRVSLDDGSSVAVKVFDLRAEGAYKSFDTESEILSTIRHRNLVPVIGCCVNTEFRALILGYMPNGSLKKWLHTDKCGYFLDLEQRLSVATDVALALEYLHRGHTFPVVHCDVKPSNVLLDEDMTAHLGDFGISKLLDEGETMVVTKTLATIGYAAPEYGSEGKVSTSGDVYSYGILLLEMFTGKRPTDEIFGAEISLREWVSRALMHGNLVSEVVSPVLLSSDDPIFPVQEQCLSSVFELAMKCSTVSVDGRIDMVQVVATLHNIKARLTTRVRQ
ncbi:leucine-rich receptor-like protein kinase family protein [Striga asiatica]|uniref:non-specific serine/threonine protein kinase n=1 Tax=Striga asiatica TaxID=4170 RepID=A0A5A7P420_STRAF|nr:leucine-rich receptor-like protein kinase family protein [Striga asiatica]